MRHRHAISDDDWARIKDLLPGQPGQHGKIAKDKPGTLSFGTSGVGTASHLFAELFASMTGTKMTHVTYRGSVPALNDVVAGHIDFMFCDFASAVGMLQSDKVRPLGELVLWHGAQDILFEAIQPAF